MELWISSRLFCSSLACPDRCLRARRSSTSSATMPPKESGFKKIPDKLTDAEKKKKQQENKAKANPKLAEAKKEKNDACRERRKESGSSKTFS